MNSAATIAFWLAVVLAVSGSVVVLWRAWVQWRKQVELERERWRRGIRDVVQQNVRATCPPRPDLEWNEIPYRPIGNPFELICDEALKDQTAKAIERANSRRPKYELAECADHPKHFPTSPCPGTECRWPTCTENARPKSYGPYQG